MSFSAAIVFLKDGQRLYRKSWPVDKWIAVWFSSECMNNFIYCNKSGNRNEYHLSSVDLLASDWDILEDNFKPVERA